MGVSESWKQLQKHTDVVYSYCRKWRQKANVNKSAIRTFVKGLYYKAIGSENRNYLGYPVYILGDYVC